MSTTNSTTTSTNTTNAPPKLLLRPMWLIGWSILLVIGSISVYDVSYETCGYRYPILLSRALTTDPYRGIILSYCLLAICASFSLQKSFLLGGFLGFFSAFLVSMFETSAHNFLIVISSLLILFECMPNTNDDTKKKLSSLWTYHWYMTVILGGIFIACKNYIAQCSFVYVVEYLLFLSMFSLVTWLIPHDMELKDNITNNNVRATAIDTEPKRLKSGKFKVEF